MKENKQTMIMGVLNVTPDSFSDGGKHNEPVAAVKRAFEMQQQGADIIDIGGESTRPGAEPVSVEEQLARVIPVIEGIRAKDKTLLISVDTTSNKVAELALEAGANWINDISAGEDSEQILDLAAEKNCPIVLMHRQGKSKTMQDKPFYNDVCSEVEQYLKQRAELAIEKGIERHNIILDPGIGFGKTLEHNLQIMKGLDSLVSLGFPILLGTSRKRFLGKITGEEIPEKRVAATCASTVVGVSAGVQIFRVHDIKANKQAIDVALAIKNA